MTGLYERIDYNGRVCAETFSLFFTFNRSTYRVLYIQSIPQYKLVIRFFCIIRFCKYKRQ